MDESEFLSEGKNFGLVLHGQMGLNGLYQRNINNMRPDLHGRRAGERKHRMKGTWGSPTEVPSRGTKSQPTGDNKKCFYHYKMNLKKHQPPCFSQTKVVTSVQLMVHYNPKGGISFLT